MWCTRWYLPLVLLPIPIAPPYFLFLFLFSTTMHARPCFYCMVLLTAMFMSTCYWPPVPIDTPLVRPWSKNVTTFQDALRSMLPDLPQDKFPSTIPVADRCWCDFSSGFFASFNTTKWEELSVTRLKETLEKEMAAEVRAREKAECEAAAGEDITESAACTGEEEPVGPTDTMPSSLKLTLPEKYILQAFQVLRPRSTSIHATPSPAPSVEEHKTPPEPSPSMETATVEHSKPTRTPEESTVGLLWLRRGYDLRRFGFAMVLDFGWSTASQP
ncbi:hypothetical protein C8Q74DRAFT_1291276 [Fomes fomentarius]|nr:hypothetical protein C8Q74DRAFT_1291276 [Fomes fomentarius]